MIIYDDGLKLASGMAIDFQRRQQLAFVSHAHGDHMARHELAVCTASTAAIYQHRLGRRRVKIVEYGEPWKQGDDTLTAVPAGHMLGSAMLLVERGLSLLYTGDFQRNAARTAAPIERFPQVDVLIMESTFGDPRWTLPDVDQTEAELLEWIDDAWRQDRPPVVFAYATGKSQEMIALLAEAGKTVRQHPKVAKITNVYRQQGCDLPEPLLYDGKHVGEGEVVLLPPRNHRASFLACPKRCTRIGVTGWGIDPRTRHRLQVDRIAVLSDHADYPQLVSSVEQAAPELVLCTHGSPKFVTHLRALGYDAHELANNAAALIANKFGGKAEVPRAKGATT